MVELQQCDQQYDVIREFGNSQQAVTESRRAFSRPQSASEVRLDAVQNVGAVLSELDVNVLRGSPSAVFGRAQQSRTRSSSRVRAQGARGKESRERARGRE